MTLSVIIPSYNSAATIGRTLEGLLCHSEPHLKEILVVDSSDDGRTPVVIAPFCKDGKVRLIRLQEKTMPAVARNSGAREASGDLLAFIDSDAYPDENWLNQIVRAVGEGCRAGGGAVLLPPFQFGDPLASAQYYLQFNEFMPVGARRVVPFTPSCNLFCEKELFEAAGGFPEIRASEDVLFGARVSRTAPFWFDPSIRVAHIFGASWKRLWSNQRLLGRYALLYRRGPDQKWMYAGLWPALFLPAFLAIKFLRISLRILASGHPADGGRYLLSLPVFLAGLLAWARGFWGACFEKSN